MAAPSTETLFTNVRILDGTGQMLPRNPLRDVRVRQGLNYCVDRDGLVQLLNGTAEPSVGWLKPSAGRNK